MTTFGFRNILAAVIAFLALLGAACSSDHDEKTASASEASSVARYTYAFDSSGLSTSVESGESSYTISQQGNVLTAGSSTYRFDPLGRVEAIDDAALVYGPDGQIAQVTRGAQTVAYLYDENGQRILKKTNDLPTAAYVDEGYLTTAGLEEPVLVGDHLVGVLRNGNFALLATDTRGTVQADSNGTQRLASPFGDRTVHPDVAQAIDYAAQGHDPDLGTVRMGVRDYDPKLGRFLSPDPLFLEHPEKCTDAPVEYNLYGYVRNRPLDFVDPTGNCGICIGAAAAAVTVIGFGMSAPSDTKEAPADLVGMAGSVPGVGQATGGLLKGAVARIFGKAAPAAAAPVARAAQANSGHVFWSGGEPAKNAANAYARNMGGNTIGMTAAGAELEVTTASMEWSQARPLWDAASKEFASSARGKVDVFLAKAPTPDSIWRTTELPALKANPNVTQIVVHVATEP